jgi:hypothetical protein
MGFSRAYDKSHKSCARTTSLVTSPTSLAHLVWVSVFRKLTSKKTCRKEKKGRRGGETNANRAGTGGAGAAITARTSNALKAFCYQRCTCRLKKNKEMKDLDQKKRNGYIIEQTSITSSNRHRSHHQTDTDHIIKQTPITSSNRHRSHHQTDTDHIIKQTPTHSSSDAYANLFERQFFSLCFLPFVHRTRRRQCAAALRGSASFRCFPHPFSLVFIIFLLTDQRHGRQCAGARSGCM